MPTSKQIAFDFDVALAPTPAASTVEVILEPTREDVTALVVDLPKTKRGRKPKPASLIVKEPSKRGRMALSAADEAADLVAIPDDETLFQKQYYTIGQVATMFGVNHSLLRMWSNEFSSFLQTRTNKKGDRYYRPEDVKTFHLINHLLRQRKFTMQGAKEFLKKNKKIDARFEILQSLEKIKGFLLEIKASL
jgi:DNA-binding transcriptional MerR regulator